MDSMLWLILIIQGIVFGFSTSYVAGQKGKDKNSWFFIGFFLGIIGLLIIGFSKDEIEETNYKTKNYIKDQIDSNKVQENKTFNATIDFNSPIDILWNSIVVDENKVELYSDFKNLSKNKVSSIIFDVELFNSFNKPIKAGLDSKNTKVIW